MKKAISLLFALVFIFVLSVPAYAEYGDWDPNIVGSDGHLHSCTGGDCSCEDILISAELEYRAMTRNDMLRVKIHRGRSAEHLWRDCISAEVLPVYNNAMFTENEDYLEAHENVRALLSDFYGGKNLAKDLYRPDGFIHNQVMNCYWYLVPEHEQGGSTEVEYRMVQENARALENIGIGLYDGSKAADEGRKFVFAREKVGNELFSPLEYEVSLRAGGFFVRLPDGYGDRGFALGLSLNENGSVRVLLADEEGKLIPGARITMAVDKDAGSGLCLSLLEESGALRPVEDAEFSGAAVSFTAATGDELFVLSEN